MSYDIAAVRLPLPSYTRASRQGVVITAELKKAAVRNVIEDAQKST